MGEVRAGPGARTCSHTACRWPAAATLSFDYERRLAWIEELGTQPDPSSYDLCSAHAGRFRPPMGWASEDRRRSPRSAHGALVEAGALEGAEVPRGPVRGRGAGRAG